MPLYIKEVPKEVGEYIRHHFRYDESTGHLYRTKTYSKTVDLTKPVGSKNSQGYLDVDLGRAYGKGLVKNTQAYQDASTTRLFEKDFPDGRVQVSLRWKYEHMCRAWDSVSSGFYGKYLNKRSKDYADKGFVTDFMSMLYHMDEQVFFIKPVDTH